MDDFGVLVKHYGINPKGKSAPMAASKAAAAAAPKTQKNHAFVNQDLNFFSQPFSKSNSGNGSLLDDQNDDIFGFNSNNKRQSYANGDVFDDVFQLPTKSSGLSSGGSGGGGGGGGGFGFDMESMFKGSGNSSAKSPDVMGDDDIWGFSEDRSTNVGVGSSDLLSSDPVDDFWGKMAKLGLEQKGVKRLEDDKGNTDNLIPGFGSRSAAHDRPQASAKERYSGTSSLEELENFATSKIRKVANGGNFTAKSGPSKKVEHKSSETNFFDMDGSIDGGFTRKQKMEKVETMFQDGASDLDSFFSAHTQKRTPISVNTTKNMKTHEEPNLFSGNAFGMEKKVSARDFPDDFSSMFEGSPASGAFQEIEGESEERRSLRFARYQRAKARAEHALAEMNQREFKAQQEQEEKHRIADSMEMEMKSWAAGKEGNLRALLSSLQQVLGPEFGWRPVTLTDLITSSQVKIAYKKAALCIHPDKVQQRGASLQQKYVAEKAFDLLKEAWNKFSTEELR